MHAQATWMRLFLFLSALALVVVAVPIESSRRAVAPLVLSFDAPAETSDFLSRRSTDDDITDDTDIDIDNLWRRDDLEGRSGIGGLLKLGEDGVKVLGKSKATTAVTSKPAEGIIGKAASDVESALGKSKAPAEAAAAAPKAAEAPKVLSGIESEVGKVDKGKGKALPEAEGVAKAAVAAPAAKAKAVAKGEKAKLPSAIPSNSKINKLKDQDTLFFSGTGGKEGTAAAKAFAKEHNLKTIDDAFPPGTLSNFKQFGGTEEEKKKFLNDASENFAKAVKPGAGRVFTTFPGDKPPADGIFNTIEAPALKANGHTVLTKLDFANLGKITDPHAITDEFHL